MRVKKLEDIHLVASRHSERKSASLSVRRSKTSLLKFPNTLALELEGMEEDFNEIERIVMDI